MKHTNNDFFRPASTADLKWNSDRPSAASMPDGRLMIDMPNDCHGQRNMERYLTWLAWKGQDATVGMVRIRSWKNLLKSAVVLTNWKAKEGATNVLFSTLIPILPFRRWFNELRSIWNGVSIDMAREIPSHIHVPGYSWMMESHETNDNVSPDGMIRRIV
jgi:hypothetical protein